ncbi:MAG: hypothetical protein ACJASL_004703 [Paraglaciecola sp.]|jgi:hypothetical protein
MGKPTSTVGLLCSALRDQHGTYELTDRYAGWTRLSQRPNLYSKR